MRRPASPLCGTCCASSTFWSWCACSRSSHTSGWGRMPVTQVCCFDQPLPALPFSLAFWLLWSDYCHPFLVPLKKKKFFITVEPATSGTAVHLSVWHSGCCGQIIISPPLGAYLYIFFKLQQNQPFQAHMLETGTKSWLKRKGAWWMLLQNTWYNLYGWFCFWMCHLCLTRREWFCCVWPEGNDFALFDSKRMILFVAFDQKRTLLFWQSMRVIASVLLDLVSNMKAFAGVLVVSMHCPAC